MREKAALDFVKEVRQQAPGIGLVKLWYMYNREDRGELRIGRDKFVRFMSVNSSFGYLSSQRATAID